MVVNPFLKKKRVVRLKQSSQAGMMMIEVLVAILIFSTGLMGLIALQTVTVQNATNAQYRSLAASLSNDIVTQMWIRKTADPAVTSLAADIVSWKDRVESSDLPNAKGIVERTGGITSVIVQYKLPFKLETDNPNQFATQVVIPE